ncbi:hypothetical protein RND71_014495 [Anisodus tanguticus]|uniref:Phosphatase tensin-type domain-containing protein n=1 Tax=Anisodus tanguticus TaxID=243964 RepID=A0AAE1SAQ9_9SOLA|nr:hypothetical protein RND71_014495 [Anisodus tanguticus]
MGLRLSKQGLKKPDNLSISELHHSLINYLSRSFRIPMAFPVEHVRAVFRNPLWQVKSVLDMRHAGHYKVYNLCIEQAYDVSYFHGPVERYLIDDNHIPPLIMIKDFCEDVYSWLSRDPKNIVVAYCMVRKGRTGLMVCSYLFYSGMSAEEALQVSIPSQRRYVKYWELTLSFPKGVPRGPPTVNLPKSCKRELRSRREYCPPAEVSKSCCRRIKNGIQRTYGPRYFYSFVEENEDEMEQESSMLYQKTCLDHFYDEPVQVCTSFSPG